MQCNESIHIDIEINRLQAEVPRARRTDCTLIYNDKPRPLNKICKVCKLHGIYTGLIGEIREYMSIVMRAVQTKVDDSWSIPRSKRDRVGKPTGITGN